VNNIIVIFVKPMIIIPKEGQEIDRFSGWLESLMMIYDCIHASDMFKTYSPYLLGPSRPFRDTLGTPMCRDSVPGIQQGRTSGMSRYYNEEFCVTAESVGGTRGFGDVSQHSQVMLA
jgi:hypothetical protein